ncbi:MAG: hypothetical protein CL483_04665 [Acidobacteria bacterium]|jgi:(p)ppGpp synthase/HD superfamily hydrolase|nr:hypothetical protein [Acidobacteriota bacterium]|tara:strand:+ start:208 stop:771 length:564 start_codon:yes stop_codon:yes gene_type:complete
MLSPRIELAITTMLEAHGLGRRKSGRSFEATHVLAVGLIVKDSGFNENAVIAGILHDTLEDTDLERKIIERRFGPDVLATVEDVTEPPRRVSWRTRKDSYITQIRDTPRDDARAVASADKIHNLSSMVAGLEEYGPSFADVFTAGLSDMVWYQETVHQTLAERWSHDILDEHERELTRFVEIARNYM